MDSGIEDRLTTLGQSRISAPASFSLHRLASLNRLSPSGGSEPTMYSRLSPSSASHRLTLLQELDNITSLANLDSRTGMRDEVSDAFRLASLRRCQTFQQRRTDPGVSRTNSTGGNAPRHLVQFIQSVNADPVVRSLSRSLSLGLASHRHSAGDRFSSVQGTIVPLPIQEEEVEGEEEKVENTAKDTEPSASAHITLDEPPNLDPLRLEPPPSDISAAEDFLVVEEPVRPSFNGRTSRLARMTSRRISEAGNSVIVVSVPQPLSPVAGPSAFELAANAAVESHDRLSYSRSCTSRNPWAPLPGPPMSEGMVARRSVEGAPLLRTMDSMRLPRS